MDAMKKYDDLMEKAQLVRNVGKKITDIIDSNNSSIDWYRSYMADKIAANPDLDCSYYNEQIDELEKENAIIREVEKMFWSKYVF